MEEQLSKVQDKTLPDTHISPRTAVPKKRKASELESDSHTTTTQDDQISKAKHDHDLSGHENDQGTMTDAGDAEEKGTPFKSDLGNLVSSVSLGNNAESQSRSFLGLSSGIS